jgi:hypothetical protein
VTNRWKSAKRKRKKAIIERTQMKECWIEKYRKKEVPSKKK